MKPVESLPAMPGIYAIKHIATRRLYIGSSVSLKSRCDRHRMLLLKGKHVNRKLQHAWSKHGEAAFAFEVVQLIEIEHDLREELLSWEQFWIDQLKPHYNIAPQAGSLLGLAPVQRYQFKSPTGEVIEIVNLNAFCREKGLLQGAMHAVWRGKSSEHRGWRSVTPWVGAERAVRRLRNPAGEIVETNDIAGLCAQHGLIRTLLDKVILGERGHHKGWRLDVEGTEPIIFTPKVHRLISPVGKLVEVTNLKAFCRENGLQIQNLYALKKGRGKRHKGWSFAPDAP